MSHDLDEKPDEYYRNLSPKERKKLVDEFEAVMRDPTPEQAKAIKGMEEAMGGIIHDKLREPSRREDTRLWLEKIDAMTKCLCQDPIPASCGPVVGGTGRVRCIQCGRWISKDKT